MTASVSFADQESLMDALVGTWKLVSATQTKDKGEVKETYGPNPIGFLTYTADGRMSVIMARFGRKSFSTLPPPAVEAAEAFSPNTFAAYAGSYTLDGDKVIHHVEACSVQNLVNTDQERSVTLQGHRLILRGEVLVLGVMYRGELVWERLKPQTADK
jgi:hypothetical protein